VVSQIILATTGHVCAQLLHHVQFSQSTKTRRQVIPTCTATTTLRFGQSNRHTWANARPVQHANRIGCS